MQNTKTKLQASKLNAIFNFGAGIISILFGILIQKFVIENYGSNFNGFNALITSILSYVMIIDGGIALTAKRNLFKPFEDNDTKEISKWSSFLIKGYKRISLILLVIGVMVAFVSPVIFNFTYDYHIAATIVILIVLRFFVEIKYLAPLQALLDANQKSYIFAKWNLVTKILFMSLITLSVYFKLDKLVYLGLYLANSIATYVILKLVTKYKMVITYTEKIRIITEDFKYMIAHKIGGLVMNNTDIIFISILADLRTASIFAVYTMIDTAGKSLANSISTSAINQFGAFIASNKNASKEYNVYLLVNSCISIVGMLFFLIGAKYLINFIGGDQYFDKWLVILFGFNFAISQIRTTFYQVHNISTLFKKAAKAALIESISNIVISLVAILIFGTDKIIMAVIIGTIITNSWRLVYDAVIVIKKVIGDNNTVKLFISVILMSSFTFVIGIMINIIDWHQNLFKIIISTMIILAILFFTVNRVTLKYAYSIFLKRGNK